jgi:hypothetical protein
MHSGITHWVLFSIAVLFVGGCQKQSTTDRGKPITASSSGELYSNGTVRTRSPTASESAALDAIEAKVAGVDRRYPSPAIPKGVSPVKARRVLPPGLIELVDGRSIRIDGVTCAESGVEILSKFLIGPKTSLLVVPTTKGTEQPVLADVWTADDFGDGFIAYGSSAETALKNGWCDVQPNSTSIHRERYAALVSAFSDKRHRAP